MTNMYSLVDRMVTALGGIRMLLGNQKYSSMQEYPLIRDLYWPGAMPACIWPCQLTNYIMGAIRLR